MKQIINKFSDGKIADKYYENDSGQIYGLYVSYWFNGKLVQKTNYVNCNRYGLSTWWNENGKINEQKYYL